MQTSTKCYIMVAVVVVLGCVYGGLYWYACQHPLTPLAEKMLSEEKRAEKLVGLLDDPEHWLDVIEALTDIGEPAIPALIRCLRDGDADLRLSAVFVLGDIGGPSALPVLRGLITDADERIRQRVAEVFGWLRHSPAVPALTACLSDASQHVRYAAAHALGEIGDASALPELQKLLHDEDEWVRQRAEEAIARIRAAQGAVPPN